MNTDNLIYLIEDAEQGSDIQTIDTGVAARAELNALLARIHALEAERDTERVTAETLAIRVHSLEKRVSELETALGEMLSHHYVNDGWLPVDVYEGCTDVLLGITHENQS